MNLFKFFIVSMTLFLSYANASSTDGFAFSCRIEEFNLSIDDYFSLDDTVGYLPLFGHRSPKFDFVKKNLIEKEVYSLEGQSFEIEFPTDGLIRASGRLAADPIELGGEASPGIENIAFDLSESVCRTPVYGFFETKYTCKISKEKISLRFVHRNNSLGIPSSMLVYRNQNNLFPEDSQPLTRHNVSCKLKN